MTRVTSLSPPGRDEPSKPRRACSCRSPSLRPSHQWKRVVPASPRRSGRGRGSPPGHKARRSCHRNCCIPLFDSSRVAVTCITNFFVEKKKNYLSKILVLSRMQNSWIKSDTCKRKIGVYQVKFLFNSFRRAIQLPVCNSRKFEILCDTELHTSSKIIRFYK